MTRFYTTKTKNFLGEDPQTPSHCDITYTFYHAKTIISNVFCMEEQNHRREVIFMNIIALKAVSIAKIDFDQA